MTNAQPTSTGPVYQPQQRNFYIALILSVIVGGLGVDRFYLGKIGTGILKLITGGGLGVWYIIDIVLIATGQMRDQQGRPLTTKLDLPQ
jgi:TM2 domain-containing membrane protein YozV